MLTKQQAIVWIDCLECTDPEQHEAKRMAIEALKERKTGRWYRLRNGNVECSECYTEQPVDSYYCPFCGAQMKGAW